MIHLIVIRQLVATTPPAGPWIPRGESSAVFRVQNSDFKRTFVLCASRSKTTVSLLHDFLSKTTLSDFHESLKNNSRVTQLPTRQIGPFSPGCKTKLIVLHVQKSCCLLSLTSFHNNGVCHLSVTSETTLSVFKGSLPRLVSESPIRLLTA
jgi:hypothetical protein